MLKAIYCFFTLCLVMVAGPCPGQSAWTFTGNTTLTWEQAIARYEELDRSHVGARLLTIGEDDDGSPIHLFVVSDGSGFTQDSVRAAGKNILWITNGIHPGEPDGIDASLLLAQALLEGDQYMGLLANTAVCIVPVYNVWGAKQRQRSSRPDQNGPKVHGIRANARNLDLNRDFIKMDARNTWAMVEALTRWDPDVYLETHVSDGADHQYVMELLTTQKDKLDPTLSAFMLGTMVPDLYAWMDRRTIPMCPYFETVKDTPEEGLMAFNDGPRYSTGYNALFDRIGILAESHMLKPYADRVNATLQLMFATLASMNEHGDELKTAREKAKEATRTSTGAAFNWVLDSTSEMTPWRGYKATNRISPVTGLEVLYYDHHQPTNDSVPWYGSYKSSVFINKPKAYLVPQQWHEVIACLKANGVAVDVLDTTMTFRCVRYDVVHHDVSKAPYESHFLWKSASVEPVFNDVVARRGDVLVPMGRTTDRFVMSVLEPEPNDSYLTWNFFDAVVSQKEWFTPYAFDTIAQGILERDPGLRARFNEERRSPEFASDPWRQYNFILQHSPYAEGWFPRHPILRIEH
ncbi:MAG: hypothetical protein IPJ76_18190 [Flavobacteriales bacterium]|nr:MAG: hypothetical protein IPJ76_18190 [Flavobacteriales bacterium]